MNETGMDLPGGSTGTGPAADPTERRHRHHYGYAFKGVPALIFAEGDETFLLFVLSQSEFARGLWLSSGGSKEDAEQLMVTAVRTRTHDVAVITMPPVRHTPEAIYVAIARPLRRNGPDEEPPTFRILYLEAGLDRPMIGEKFPNGNHATHGRACEPVFEKFAALLDTILHE